jgi:AhpD family alkylhydroperoxidase
MASVSRKNELLLEIQEAFGLVPEWAKTIPDPAIEGFWTVMRDFQLAETKIPNKYKELIGLAVSGATRCKYCQLFHVEAARLFGATDEEIAEASMMGGFTMMASTYLNAQGVDYERFADETKRIIKHVKAQQGQTPRPASDSKARARV